MAIAAGRHSTIALLAGGALRSWGELALNESSIEIEVEVAVEGDETEVSAIAIGDFHVAVLHGTRGR